MSARFPLAGALGRSALVLLVVSADLDARADQGPQAGQDRTGPPLKVVLIGDSTVAESSGWGPGFAKRLGPGATCINEARGGRSSKSYRDEGHWTRALAQRPDFVLIQFGHNDQPGKGPERETDPATTYRRNLARYIDEARASGAVPILVTSLTRRNFDGRGKVRPDGLLPYVEAARALAKEKDSPLVDLYARSVAALEAMGPIEAAALNPPGKTPDVVDRTHLTPEGARIVSGLVADGLREVEPRLAKHLESSRGTPTGPPIGSDQAR